jgi:hypothetical protein
MLLRLKKSLEDGVGRIRWFSSLLCERLKVEIAVIRLLRESDDLEKRRREFVNDIGERVYELRGRSELDLLMDPKIKGTLKELESLDGELEEMKSRVSEISRVED